MGICLVYYLSHNFLSLLFKDSFIQGRTSSCYHICAWEWVYITMIAHLHLSGNILNGLNILNDCKNSEKKIDALCLFLFSFICNAFKKIICNICVTTICKVFFSVLENTWIWRICIEVRITWFSSWEIGEALQRLELLAESR